MMNLSWLSYCLYLAPIILALNLVRHWWLVKKSNSISAEVVTKFNPPKDLSPAEVGILIDGHYNSRDLVAELINLVVKGYIKIDHVLDDEGYLIDYVFKHQIVENTEPSKIEKGLLEGLFIDSQEIHSDYLNRCFHLESDLLAKRIYRQLIAKGLVTVEPDKVRFRYLTVALVIFLIGGPVVAYYFGWWYFILILIISLEVILYGGYAIIDTIRANGRRQELLGLKLYLTTAEQDRFDFHYAPGDEIKSYEHLLPYAIALGMNKKWVKTFGQMYFNDQEVSEFGRQAMENDSLDSLLMLFGESYNFLKFIKNLFKIFRQS